MLEKKLVAPEKKQVAPTIWMENGVALAWLWQFDLDGVGFCEGVKNTRKGGFELGFQKQKRFPFFFFSRKSFEIYSYEIKDNARSRNRQAILSWFTCNCKLRPVHPSR